MPYMLEMKKLVISFSRLLYVWSNQTSKVPELQKSILASPAELISFIVLLVSEDRRVIIRHYPAVSDGHEQPAT